MMVIGNHSMINEAVVAADQEAAEEEDELAVTPSQMLRRGLKLLGLSQKVQNRRDKGSNVRVFKSHYGVHPNHTSTAWRDIINTQQLDEHEVDLKAFFMALNFLRCYDNEDIRATRFGVDKWKMRKLVWCWIQRLANLKALKIKIPDSWDTTFVFSIDGTHYRINEPRHATLKQDPSWYSHKHGCAGHNVQIALAIFSQQLYDMTISKGGTNDKGNLHKSGILDKIPAGKRAIVDGGYYQGDVDKLSGYNQFDSDVLKKFKSRVKSRHENFNMRLKIFNVLGDKFVHDKEKFPSCMEAVAVLVQYTIEDTNPESAAPLFDV